ncbi:MAG TPA: glutamine synthetase beta-grasp domain-containing protein, partial [archaeon]|nr:glutamine synthetase beta-grasp domain-containing protein [archaeon]
MPATRQKPPSHAAAEWRAFAEASLASYDPELLKGVAAVDLWFSDLLGQGQHFSIPPRALTPRAVAHGIGYDGSSIRLSQAIHKSDMLVVPDLGAAFRDPVREHPTLAVPCWTVDPVTGAGNNRDPRVVASRAEAALAASGIADAAYVGPESEFFIFDRVSHRALPHESGFSIESDEAHWNHGNGDGRAIAPRRGYFPLPPMDRYQDLRT